MLVPVLKDIPGIQRLNLEVGARWSDYNTAGKIWTYKGLVDWTVVDSVRLRGGYQLANRAPNVAELFTGATTSVVGFPGADPCMANTTQHLGQYPAQHGEPGAGHRAVQRADQPLAGRRESVALAHAAELPQQHRRTVPVQLPAGAGQHHRQRRRCATRKPKTWTAGVVFKSPFEGIMSNATLAVDWYQVKIKDAIAPTNAWSVYAKCLNQDGSNPTYDVNNDYCKLITA